MGLYTSRGGRRWTRVNGPGPWVDNGKPGSIDYGYAYFTAAGRLTYDGKTHIPYLAGADKQHWYSNPPPGGMVDDSRNRL